MWKARNIVVAKGRINSPPLSNDTLIELGMLKLQPDGGLTSPNAMPIENVKQKTVKLTINQPEQQQIDTIIAKYNHLFQAIGKITDKKNNREIYGYASLTQPLLELTRNETKFHWCTEEQGALKKLMQNVFNDDTIAFFHPECPTKAYFNAPGEDGNKSTSSAVLSPMSNGDIAKDALCVKWAKDRFSIYLMRAPRFIIVTAHKPLLPLFNKATAKLPSRIEKLAMNMQDVDYECDTSQEKMRLTPWISSRDTPCPKQKKIRQRKWSRVLQRQNQASF
ncbi:Hypothetical predicted protein [Paramuricea clavata]|uniref:Reverse transcriptase RNase H-like domain-containing protein n=1 Tax=Paramuricea clavata TaxID=317549 RepID=A0A7D9HF17_PARCT|nr:Hypothetical predicted protein [Paramuricea clavata]